MILEGISAAHITDDGSRVAVPALIHTEGEKQLEVQLRPREHRWPRIRFGNLVGFDQS